MFLPGMTNSLLNNFEYSLTLIPQILKPAEKKQKYVSNPGSAKPVTRASKK